MTLAAALIEAKEFGCPLVVGHLRRHLWSRVVTENLYWSVELTTGPEIT